MSKYPMVRLEDVCDKATSSIAQKDLKNLEGIYPIYGASGFIKNINFYKQDREYIAIVKDGAGIGRAMILPAFSSVIGTMQYILPKDNIITKYLYFAIDSMNLAKYFTGATIPHIYFKDYKNEFLPLPPIENQRSIIKILESIVSLIIKRKQQLSEFDELAKSRFLEMFGDPILNPMGWAISHYGDEFEIMSGGTPKTDIPEYWVNGKISWIGSNLCQNSVLIENDGKFITEKGLNNSSAKIFNKGYILIALVGATIGKVAHLKFSTSTNQNIAGINVPQNENYIPEFVFYNTQFLYPKFMDIGNSKFKMANLSFIRSLQIPIVPIKAQKKFSNFVEQLDKSKFRIKKSLEKLEMTYKALLQEYFG